MSTAESRAERLREIDGRTHFSHRVSDDMNALRHPQTWEGNLPIVTTASDIAFAQNALSSQDGTQGGYLRPEPTAGQILEVGLTEASVMRQVCTVIPGTHIDETFALLDDGGAEGRILAENTSTTATDPAFAARASKGYFFHSDAVLVSNALLQDVPNLGQSLFSALGQRLGRIQNRKFSIGLGAGQPTGIVTAATIGKTCTSTSAIAFDELVDLSCALNSEYLNSPDCRWMMHPLVYAIVRKLKDGAGQYLWETSGMSRYPVSFNSHMVSSLSANARPIVFGNFRRGYVIRELGTKLITYHDKYADTAQTGFEAGQNADGFLVDSSAVVALAMAAS